MSGKKTSYTVLMPLTLQDGSRAEPGDTVTADQLWVPPEMALYQGTIKKTAPSRKKPAAKKPAVKPKEA